MTEGQGLVLNNIEIQDDYGVKQGKTPHRAMLITDPAGGKTILKIWGPGSAQTFHKGGENQHPSNLVSYERQGHGEDQSPTRRIDARLTSTTKNQSLAISKMHTIRR